MLAAVTDGGWCLLCARVFNVPYLINQRSAGSDLAKEEVELLARAVVASLRQEELNLLLNLLLVQVPAVLIVHAGSGRGVRGPYEHTNTSQIKTWYLHFS